MVKVLRFFYIEILISLLQNAINTFYNLYYDYWEWDLFTNFWPGFKKCNTTFDYKIHMTLGSTI